MVQNNWQFEPLLLRGGEVARLIGCSRAMAYRLMQRGVIPTVRLTGGKTVRVPREALVAWIKANTQPAHVLSIVRGVGDERIG
jgi:excisionase family DNA binding protein